jgi:putative flippase GtrA
MKEPKEFDYFKAWLLFFLIATVGGGILAMILGSFVAAFLGAGGMPLAQMTRILQIIGFVIAIPISYLTFRAVVGKYLFPKIEDDAPPKT